MFGIVSLITLAVSGYTAWRARKIIDVGFDLPGKIADFLGAEYVTILNQNPLMGMLFKTAIIVTVLFFCVIFLARFLRIKVPKVVSKFVVIAPIALIALSIPYVGYLQYLKNKDDAYKVLKNATTYKEAKELKEKAGISHKENQRNDPRYFFKKMNDNLAVPVYEEMINDIGASTVASLKIKEDIGDNFNPPGEQELTALQYASYHGCTNAVQALAKNPGIPLDASLQMDIMATCPRDPNRKLRIIRIQKYRQVVFVTAWNLAARKKYTHIQKIIEESAQIRKVNYKFASQHENSVCFAKKWWGFGKK